MLGHEGALVLLCPLIVFRPPRDWTPVDQALGRLSDYDGLIFTSVNAVRFFFLRMNERSMQQTSLQKTHCFAVGPATAEELLQRGLPVQALPEQFRAEGLAGLLENVHPKGRRFLFPRALGGRDVLPASLRQMGAVVDLVVVYETCMAVENRQRLQELLAARSLDYATFTSSSTVDAFAAFASSGGADVSWRQVRAACIGEVTAASARAHGFSQLVVAQRATVDGLVQAIIDFEQSAPLCRAEAPAHRSGRDQP